MKRRETQSLQDVRAARPPLEPSAEEWLSSDRGQRVLERVLAADRAASGRRPVHQRRSGWWAGPRLAFAGAALVVVVAVALTVALAGIGGDHGGPVASTGTSAPAAAQVSSYQAVADVMPLYQRVNLQDSTPASGAALIEKAVKLGLVDRSAVSGPSSSAPMNQGDFALLLVKAFGALLPNSPTTALTLDPAATAGPDAAIAFLKSRDVIVAADGAFDPSRALTPAVEDRLLNRIEESLKSLME